MTQLTRRSVLVGLAATGASGVAGASPSAPPDAYRSATELAAALAARQISARELLEAEITRIETLDPTINAVVVRDFDRAREAAGAADLALGRGERGPLLGIPMTVKEQFNVAGLPTTWGIERFRDWRPTEDALAVQRLKAAGAIIMGKTNVPVGLADWQSDNPIYGTTNNPWDLKRTPGGSSGGAAAALAAGFTPLELGSDLGGSLRAPAHYCGVFAHKPSINVVPQRGASGPGTPARPVVDDMAAAGPLARSAADLALELSALAGPDPLWDGIGYKLVLPAPRHDRLADYRVLLLDAHPLCPTAESVRAAMEELAGNLTKSGCAVLRKSEKMPALALTTRNYEELLAALFDTDLPAEEWMQAQAAASKLSPDDLSMRAAEIRGVTMSHGAWENTTFIRYGLRARWQALFQEIDVVLCPPMPTPAFLQDKSPVLTRTVDIDGKKIRYLNQVAWCGIATLNGFPATVAPIARTEDGLPVGVQIIGGYLEDRTTIAFAGLLEQAFGGFAKPPALPA